MNVRASEMDQYVKGFAVQACRPEFESPVRPLKKSLWTLYLLIALVQSKEESGESQRVACVKLAQGSRIKINRAGDHISSTEGCTIHHMHVYAYTDTHTHTTFL